MISIKRVGLFSAAKIFSVVFLITGILSGILFALIGGQFLQDYPHLDGLGKIFWILAFTLFPISFSILGFIIGLLFGFIYNISSKLFGGLKVEETMDDSDNWKKQSTSDSTNI